MVTYGSREGMAARFGRRPATRPALLPDFGGTLDVENFLHHHGQALARRFDANSYLYLTKAMDHYDIGRDGDEASWLAKVTSPLLLLGVRTDWLFPPEEIRDLASLAARLGVPATYAELDSPHGHDAFLKDWPQLDLIIRPFIARTLFTP